MNGTGRPARRPANNNDHLPETIAQAVDGPVPCETCERWITPRCQICRGRPDPGIRIEDVARWVSQVDRATRRAA
jgi:hypothetical protein